MYTRNDIASLSASFDMAVRHGNAAEARDIAVELELVDEMHRPDFVLTAASRVFERDDIGELLCAAFAANNISGLGLTFAKLLEVEARRMAIAAINTEMGV